MAAQHRLLAALGALSTALVLVSEPGEAQEDLPQSLLDSEISTLHSRMNTALAQLRTGATRVVVPVAVAAGRADSIGAPVGIVTPNG